MKPTTSAILTILGAVPLAAMLTIGCASSKGYQKAGTTAANLQDSGDHIATTQKLLNDVMTSLNDLVDNPHTDLTKQYKRFDAAKTKLDASAKKVRSTAEQIGKDRDSYAKTWSAQLGKIKNDEMKAASHARMDEVNGRLNDILTTYQSVHASYTPFSADLKDVQTVLGVDLSTSGLAIVRPAVRKANDHVGPLKASIDDLERQFRALGVEISPKSQD